MAGPDIAFWQQRFDTGNLPWDRGAPNPQLLQWLAEGSMAARRGGRIAVPGCGSGHEVVALAQAGFQVTALDYAPGAIALTQARLLDAGLGEPLVRVLQQDVLQWQPPEPLDAVYEQTCLCALHPDHWVHYADRLRAWLRPGGQLALLAMQAARAGAASGLIEGPPYHVDVNALRALLPAAHWEWPRPPYAQVPHPGAGQHELALLLVRR